MSLGASAAINQQRRGATALRVTVLALCSATAIAGLWPVYQSSGFLILVAATLTVASLIAILGTKFRWRAPVVALAVASAFLALGVPLAVPDSALFGVFPTLEGLQTLLFGSVSGWKQLLTVILPVGTFSPLLVPPFIALLVTHTVSLILGLRSGRRQLALIGPLLLFFGTISFGSSAGFLPVYSSAAFAAAVMGWLMLSQRVRFEARAILGAMLIIVISLAGGLAPTVLAPPAGERVVLRSALTQRFDPNERVSPLSGFRAYHGASTSSSAMLHVRGLPPGERLRLATLSNYDGITFSVADATQRFGGGSFALVPHRFDQSAQPGQRVELAVVVDGYSDVWLPTVGAFQSVALTASETTNLREEKAIYYDNGLRTASVTPKLVRGDSFRLAGVLPTQPRLEQLPFLSPGIRASGPPANLLTVPAGLRTRLDKMSAAFDTPGGKLQAVLAALRTEGFLSHGVVDTDPASRSGHSANRITELVTAARMIGDAEQYATTAAIMAEQLGFPSRVVMGFDPTRAQAGTADAGSRNTGSITLTGADITAWLEVRTREFGWVSFETTPAIGPAPEPTPESASELSRPRTIVPPRVLPSPPIDPPAATGGFENRIPADAGMSSIFMAFVWALVWTLAGIAVLCAPIGAISVAKLLRRRARRRKSTALERVSESWNEFRDVALDHGFHFPVTATRTEIAAVVGGARSDNLALWADFAAFAPEWPTAVDADRCWSTVDELRSLLGANLSRWKRLVAEISLRSLGPPR